MTGAPSLKSQRMSVRLKCQFFYTIGLLRKGRQTFEFEKSIAIKEVNLIFPKSGRKHFEISLFFVFWEILFRLKNFLSFFVVAFFFQIFSLEHNFDFNLISNPKSNERTCKIPNYDVIGLLISSGFQNWMSRAPSFTSAFRGKGRQTFKFEK